VPVLPLFAGLGSMLTHWKGGFAQCFVPGNVTPDNLLRYTSAFARNTGFFLFFGVIGLL
jgi:hypothetical protein